MDQEDYSKVQTAGHLEDQDVVVTFPDRVIAFVLLIGPWGLLTVWIQDLLIDRLSTSVTNMVVLAGIIGFLLVVNWASKRIYSLRVKRRR